MMSFVLSLRGGGGGGKERGIGVTQMKGEGGLESWGYPKYSAWIPKGSIPCMAFRVGGHNNPPICMHKFFCDN